MKKPPFPDRSKVRTRLGRFIGKIRSLISRRLRRRPSFGSILSVLGTLTLFTFVGLGSFMQREHQSWGSFDSWKRGLKLAVVPIVAAAILKYSEKWKRKRGANRITRGLRRERQLTTSRALLEDLSSYLWRREPPPRSQIQQFRKSMLECVVLKLREILGLSENEPLAASLVELSSLKPRRLRVAARSIRSRDWRVEYSADDLLAGSAIGGAKLVIEDDARRNNWRGLGPKDYRSILAIPVTRNGRAYGALSLDAALPFVFFGRARDIAVEMETYVALLALTFRSRALSLRCEYEAARQDEGGT